MYSTAAPASRPGTIARMAAADPLVAAQVPPAERLVAPALLVVDMQNDFVRTGAPLEVPDARATIAAHQRLLEAFRTRGLPVLFTRWLSLEEDNLLWRWSPQCHPATRACWPREERTYADVEGSRACIDVIDELAPQPGEGVVDKLGYGSFHGTDLDARLRALGVRSLVVTGTVTQICVEETAREAFHHGYATTVVADAVSSFAPDLHAATLRNLAMKFGWVSDSDEVLAALPAA
jgi:nicotinamidase-related amidase